MSKTTYCAGPMTGIKNYNFDAFDRAEDLLHLQGFKVFNPAEMDRIEESWTRYPPEGFVPTREDRIRFMKRDLAAIDQCTHIYMLKGWENSPGARTEKAYAEFLGIEILYEK